MTLTDEQLELIEAALQRYGVTGLARKIGATRSTFYEIRRRGRGLTPDKLEKIQQLMLSKAREMPGNGPSAALEPPQAPTRRDTAEELQLLVAKVIAFVAGLREKQGNV